MHRRRILQLGAAVATLPLTNGALSGCGPAAPDGKLAPSGTGAEGVRGANTGVDPGGKLPVSEPAVTGTSAASAAPPADSGTAAADPPVTDAPKQPVAPESLFSRVIGKVGKNHGHELVVPFADVLAGVEKAYDIAGSSGHPHTVTLSADDMKVLRTGQIVRMKSSRDKNHAHRVLVRCAPAVDPPEWVSACSAIFGGQDEHELVVPIADVQSKGDHTYDVQGIAGHAHDLVIPAAGFEKLLKGEALSLITTRNDAHTHVVFIQYKAAKKV